MHFHPNAAIVPLGTESAGAYILTEIVLLGNDGPIFIGIEYFGIAN